MKHSKLQCRKKGLVSTWIVSNLDEQGLESIDRDKLHNLDNGIKQCNLANTHLCYTYIHPLLYVTMYFLVYTTYKNLSSLNISIDWRYREKLLNGNTICSKSVQNNLLIYKRQDEMNHVSQREIVVKFVLIQITTTCTLYSMTLSILRTKKKQICS